MYLCVVANTKISVVDIVSDISGSSRRTAHIFPEHVNVEMIFFTGFGNTLQRNVIMALNQCKVFS